MAIQWPLRTNADNMLQLPYIDGLAMEVSDQYVYSHHTVYTL